MIRILAADTSLWNVASGQYTLANGALFSVLPGGSPIPWLHTVPDFSHVRPYL